MGSLPTFLPLPPLTQNDLNDDMRYLPIPEDELQLQVDTLNVMENRVSIDTFPLEYQNKIKSYYKFSATRQNSNESRVAKRTGDTLDII